jgi:plasmid maintenance system antidote protein VapI
MAGGKADPKEMLQKALQLHGWSESDLAWALGYSRVFIENMLDNTYLSAEMALRLEASLGISAEAWLDTQLDHDLRYLRERMGGELVMIQRRASRADAERP